MGVGIAFMKVDVFRPGKFRALGLEVRLGTGTEVGIGVNAPGRAFFLQSEGREQ